jgi:dihydrofolate reductase
MEISLIAAASSNNVIGKGGYIPWDLPDDFRHFHEATKGFPVIMGRKTHESIGRVLLGRRNIVITRQADYRPLPGSEIAHSLSEAIDAVSDAEKVCIIGGEAVYKAALPLVTEIDLTRVHTTIEGGDAFFPVFSEDDWKLVEQIEHSADERHAHAFTFLRFRRREGK